MKTYKARGIVLHTIKYGDSSLVVYMLTDVLGRATYMVQGVKSTRGHGNKAALLQPMFPVEFEGMESPRAEMHRLRELRAAPPLRSIPFDVRKSTIALFMAEMLYRLVREVEPNSRLFDFVHGAVQALDGAATTSSASPSSTSSSTPSSPAASPIAVENGGNAGNAAVANFHLWFMVGLSRHLGFFPAGEWTPGSWFDIREGCFTPVMPRGEAFSRENAALLRQLMTMTAPGANDTPFAALDNTYTVSASADTSAATTDALSFSGAFAENLAALALNRTQRVDFLGSMLAYFGYHLDAVRDIRSVDILREVF